jgi:hypothetical protein
MVSTTKTVQELAEKVAVLPTLVAKHVGLTIPANQDAYNQIVSARTAKSYTENWQNYVVQNRNLTSLFWNVEGEDTSYTTGFSCNFSELSELVSPVGVTHYKVAFGLTEDQKIVLTLVGCDMDNEAVTPVLVLNNYTNNDFADVTFVGSLTKNVVAPIFAEEWLKNWNIAPTIPAEVFMVYGKVLNGYTVPADTLRNLLQFGNRKSNANIALTLHKYGNDQATAGLLFFSVGKNGEAYAFNFTMPCPKTCTSGKGGLDGGDWWPF